MQDLATAVTVGRFALFHFDTAARAAPNFYYTYTLG